MLGQWNRFFSTVSYKYSLFCALTSTIKLANLYVNKFMTSEFISILWELGRSLNYKFEEYLIAEH